MIKKYEKKPAIVEAMQFRRDNQEEIVKFTGGGLYCITIPSYAGGIMRAYLGTPRGRVVVSEGDYIIKNDMGDLYSRNSTSFDEIYKEV